MNDWNQYIVIARGGTFIHIVNGQLMAVMIDDDPGLVQQSVRPVRHRDRGHDQGLRPQHVAQEAELMPMAVRADSNTRILTTLKG